ncbi:MAG: hypothetical protein ABSA59_18615 [Terriglobia bacterium]|jgi:dGTP triphosphohydrolase
MDVWKEILIALGSNATLLVVLGFLARSLLNTWLTKDIKRFETDLKASADSELERLKYELKSKADASIEQLKNHLQLIATEHQVRFSKLHEKRAEVIDQVYARLVEARMEGKRFIATDAYITDRLQQKEAWKKTAERMEDVSVYIQKHRIYLPERICELLQKVVDEMSRHVAAAGVYTPLNPQAQEMIAEKYEALMKAYNAFFSESIPAATKALEDEFRRLLGVETSRPNTT